MSVMTKRAWRGLAVVPVLAALAAPASAVAAPGGGLTARAGKAAAGSAPTAYVTVAGYRTAGHSVIPIATATNTAGKPIKVGDGPADMALTPDGKTLYVVNEDGPSWAPGTVTPVATATNTPGKPIRVGFGPDGITITPNGETAYVPNITSDTVTPIATATNTPGKPIPVGVRPRVIAVTPNGKTAYVVNQGGPSTVSPVATATGKPGKPIRVGNGPLAIAITPNGKTAYVANTGELLSGHTVTPIATATNKPGKAIKVGSSPWAIAITPDGKTAYVANFESHTVTPIATATNTPGKPIKVGGFPEGIAITPDGTTAYVVSDTAPIFNPGTVTPINVATNTPGKPIKVGSEPTSIAITPNGKTAYVADTGSDTVTPINTATDTPGKPITVGRGPYEIAITPPAAPAGVTAATPAYLPGAPASLPPARTAAVTAPTGPEPVSVLPGASARLHGPLLALDLGGVRYEIPQVALPYLGRGLNPDLFRLSSLTRSENGGRLPVTVSYHDRLPALPGVTITRAGRGHAEGYLAAAGARAFAQALARQFRADHARGSYGQDGMFAGGVSIGLAGEPAAAAAPPRHYVMHTLTVTGTGLAGKPDTGDTVLVLNADNSTRFTDPIEAQQVFVHGVARFSVPAGHYWAIGFFTNLYPGIHLAVLPQFNVFRTTTVHMDGRTANSKLDMVTPRPARQTLADLTLSHPTPAGPAEMIGEFTAQNPVPIYISPTSRRPTVGTLQVFPFEQLMSDSGAPYLYELAYQHTSGLIPPLRHVVSPASLAAVHARYYFGAKGVGVYSQDAQFRGQPLPVVNGLFPTGFLQYVRPAPGRQTQYFSTGPGLMWSGFFLQEQPGGGQSDSWRFLRPGAVTQDWNAYPLHEGYNANPAGAANPAPWVPSASRAGNTLTLDVTPFSDSTAGHLSSEPFGGAVTGYYRIAENSQQLATGNPFRVNDHSRMFGEFEHQVTLSPQPGSVRFALKAVRTGRDVPALSPEIRTAWVWHSVPEKGATLPRGWTCDPSTRDGVKPVRDCAVDPMMTLEYGVPGLGLNGDAPAGRQTLHVTAGHLEDAAAAPVTGASVSVSFDGGQTWHTAHVSGHAGNYTAVFTAPAGAMVTLRTEATDAAGGSISETITSAYGIAS